MKANVGGMDRMIRIVVGIALLAAALFHALEGNLAIAAYVVGGIALGTGLVGFCPAWVALRVNTCLHK